MKLSDSLSCSRSSTFGRVESVFHFHSVVASHHVSRCKAQLNLNVSLIGKQLVSSPRFLLVFPLPLLAQNVAEESESRNVANQLNPQNAAYCCDCCDRCSLSTVLLVHVACQLNRAERARFPHVRSTDSFALARRHTQDAHGHAVLFSHCVCLIVMHTKCCVCSQQYVAVLASSQVELSAERRSINKRVFPTCVYIAATIRSGSPLAHTNYTYSLYLLLMLLLLLVCNVHFSCLFPFHCTYSYIFCPIHCVHLSLITGKLSLAFQRFSLQPNCHRTYPHFEPLLKFTLIFYKISE